ncbi:MAG: hypothetical protein JKY31_08985 [Rhodobacteraceae bacterium]|nr:hypothetical protein [Paracoccaceae bacterium]
MRISLTKIILWVVLLAILLGVLRWIFPPLTELGYIQASDEIELRVYKKNSALEEGAAIPIYLDTPDELALGPIAADLCASIIADQAEGTPFWDGMSTEGTFDFIFIGAGKYLYRVFGKETLTYSYSPDACVAENG